MAGVKILDTTQISLPPPFPQPPQLKLSLFDSFWIKVPPPQKLFLYSKPISTNSVDLSFPSLIQSLKSSLSSTLLDFLPLTAKLTYVPSTGDVEFDFSNPSATFIEAESDLDFHQLAATEIHDISSLKKLVPEIDASSLPLSVFAVQVTRFSCGAMAVGYSVHHCVGDGRAMFDFYEAWAAACRAELGTSHALDIHRKPSYDRTLIKHPKADELPRTFLRGIAPDLPITGLSSPGSIDEDYSQLGRRTFILNAASIKTLKEKMQSSSSVSRPPSTFRALSAHAWACFARAKSLAPDENTAYTILMDCRARLNPPVTEDYFGNCVSPVHATMSVGELVGIDGLVKACTVIGRAVSEASKDPLRDCDSWLADYRSLPWGRLARASGSPTFRFYEIDFGWGKPERFDTVTMANEGEFALVGGKEEGSVQVTVAMNSNHMDSFAKFFLSGFASNE